MARQEIVFHSPVTSSEQGMPIGNGRMGTLVWTQGDTIAFQLNRVDNFTTSRFHGRDQIIHDGPNVYSDDPEKPSTDQLLSLGDLRIHFPGETFGKGQQFEQSLSVADGRVSLKQDGGKGLLNVDVLVSANRDVMSMQINDARSNPRDTEVSLSLWRKPYLKQDNHEVFYSFRERGGELLLSHAANEGSFHSRYAVAVGVAGRTATVELRSAQEAVLHIGKGAGPYRILVATAAALNDTTDVAGRAANLMELTAAQTYQVTVQEHAAWWSDFWSRSFLHLHSEDGVADYLMRLYYLSLYGMGSSSRGDFPPKFNGSIWLADQDHRPWGAQYWVWNEEASYDQLLAANQVALTNPFYQMYFNQLPRAEIAARQRWEVGGAFYPETSSYDGPRELPESVAAEFRDVLLGRSSADKLSSEAGKYTYDSQLWALNRTYPKYFPLNRYSFITHILSSGSELAMEFWRRYQYTEDREWLASTAYPLMKEVSRFYLDYAKLGNDGRLHIYPTNAHESYWGVRDAITDLAAIRGLFPRCIEASEILGLDAGLRSQWRDFLVRLAPYPDGSDADAVRLDASLGPGTWAAALFGDVPGRRNYEEVWTFPVYPFFAVSPGSSDWQTALATYRLLPQRRLLADKNHSSLPSDWDVPGHARVAILSALMQQSDDVSKVVPEFALKHQAAIGGASQDPEAAGITSYAIQLALLQSISGVLHLFPAWPQNWDADFQLLAPGAVLVSSSQRGGNVKFVQLEAELATTCRLVNPWKAAVTIHSGEEIRQMNGEVLNFALKAGQTIVVTKTGPAHLLPVEVESRAASFPLRLSVTAPDGKHYQGQLGK